MHRHCGWCLLQLPHLCYPPMPILVPDRSRLLGYGNNCTSGQHVPNLTAAEIRRRPIDVELGHLEERVDKGLGDLRVVDEVTVRTQVVGIEEIAPPVGPDIVFQIFDRTNGRAQYGVPALRPARRLE